MDTKQVIVIGAGAAIYAYFFYVFCTFAIFLTELQNYFPILTKLFPYQINGIYPKRSGEPTSIMIALINNLVLLVLFAVQHHVMVQRDFKSFLARFIPVYFERSIFVLAATVCMHLMMKRWIPMTTVMWNLPHLSEILTLLALCGLLEILYSTFLIDHFDLFGLSRVFAGPDWKYSSSFVVNSHYHFVRHPMMTGVLMLLWFTPTMTLGRLLIAIVWTTYVVLGVRDEEKQLIEEFGDSYRKYTRDVPYKFVPGVY